LCAGSQLYQQPPQDSTSFVIPAPSLASLNLSSINSVKKAQIVVNFFEKKTRKAWFSKSEEEVCWEEWIINISSITPRNESEKIRVAKSAENQLQTIIMKVIDIVNDNKDHIPPIATTEANPFPYQISIPSETEDTWGSVFKKILVE
jgi:autophagy-related protein 101